MRRTFSLTALFVALAVFALEKRTSLAANSPQPVDGPQFSADGKLARPTNYRKWVFLSSGYGMVFVGVHPSLMHVPPTCSRSTSAVRIPAPASACDSGTPACPAPITIASYRVSAIEEPRFQEVRRIRAGLRAGLRLTVRCAALPCQENSPGNGSS